jgi:hypothetical protein
MALFTIEYDLRNPHRDYETLYAELKRFSASRILQSLWSFNRVNTNAVGLRDYFRQFIDANDGLIVCQVADWATYNTLGTPQAVTA